MMSEAKKSWEKRLAGEPDELTINFVESLSIDKRLYKYDIVGSIAHAHMLAEQKLITKDDFKAIKEGLIEIFIEAGAIFSTPTCGPCLGGHMGVLAAGERAVSTTNRNFVGRMGHVESEVYLSNPAIAAASAIKGYITGPDYL